MDSEGKIPSSFLLPTTEIEFKVNSTSSDYDNSDHNDFRSSGKFPGTTPVKDGANVNIPVNSRRKTRKIARTCEVTKLTASTKKMVRRWRCITVAFVLVVGSIFSIAGYFVLLQSHEAYTKQSFVTVADVIFELATRKSLQLSTEARNLARLVAATASTQNQTFPFVTVPSWKIRGKHALEISGAEFTFWMPLVETSKGDEWNSYANATLQLSEAETQSVPYVYDIRQDGSPVPATTPHYVAPIWQGYPAPSNGSYVNFNMLSLAGFSDVVEVLSAHNGTQVYVLTLDFVHPRPLTSFSSESELEAVYSDSSNGAAFSGSMFQNSSTEHLAQSNNSFMMQPRAFLFQPIYYPSVVGVVSLLLPWERYLNEVLPPSINGIYCVLENSCGELFTYFVIKNELTFLGNGDFHDPKFEGTRTVILIEPSEHNINVTKDRFKGSCNYSLSMYSSSSYSSPVPSSLPIIFVTVGVTVTVIIALAFLRYDRFARRRTELIETTAKQSTALLATLFPTNVAKRLFAEEKHRSLLSNRGRLTCYLDEITEVETKKKNRRMKKKDTVINRFVGKPIADIFPETTVLFADIAGFTAWSSHRQPEQVFKLLETIYRAFDIIARGNRVYKASGIVETIGDCYVAVTGLPDPRRDHAVAMAQFAREINAKMRVLVKKLEPILGPDTTALELRVGIHSGPVTGGVLRGDRSRFQLFGDTMNTASRMESTSHAGRVQLSQETTDLLIAAGKFHWIELRESTVVAKGKGEMQTYWLTLTDVSDSGSDDLDFQGRDPGTNLSLEEQYTDNASAEKIDRFIGWNTECLLTVLREIVARRESAELPASRITSNERHFTRFGETVIDEVSEIVSFPTCQPPSSKDVTYEDVELNAIVVDQMYDCVANIAGMYNNRNPFHNFEHSSHMVMSVIKFLSLAKTQQAHAVASCARPGDEQSPTSLPPHDRTYGIASDPLSHFSCIFGALIHGVDHAGVSNALLQKEGAPIAEFYKGRSIQEQNALDLSWQMLMDDSYMELRQVIYTNDDELRRFRQLVVNSVIATDIVDENLMSSRSASWARAFRESSFSGGENVADTRNRRATTVLEHMIQASHVFHTLQPWEVYLTWNKNLFLEECRAHNEGRADGNPAESWYHRQLAFFDFVVIPVAKKMKDCGVFGPSSEECLSHALQNRGAWEENGREIVSHMTAAAPQSMDHEDDDAQRYVAH